MERKIYEAIRVAQVHLHPVRLCVQIDSYALSEHLHARIYRLYSRAVARIIKTILKQVRKALRKHLADSDLGCFIVPFLEGFRVLRHNDISILVDWKSWQLFVQLHKGMMCIAEHSESKSF